MKMVKMNLFGSAGIRGIVGKEINEDFSRKIGNTLTKYVKSEGKDEIFLGMDTRISSKALKKSLISGLGLKIYDCEIIPTPVLGFVCKEFEKYGIMITASHNPKEYNGFKIFNDKGISFYEKEQENFENIFRNIKKRNLESKIEKFNALEFYENRIIKNCFKKVNICSNFLIDFSNGAATSLISLFERINQDIKFINYKPNGFLQKPEPTEKSLEKTIKYMKNKKIDFCMAFDGDGDRVVFIDKFGYIPPIDSCGVFARERCLKRKNKKISTNIEVSKKIEELVNGVGGKISKTRVGDVAITHNMLEIGGETAIEQCGHLFSRESIPGPDPIYSSLWLLKEIKDTQKIRKISEKTKKFYFRKQSIPCKNKTKIEKKVIEKLTEYAVKRNLNYETTDGIRIDWKDAFLLIRKSGTENVIRITAEADREKKANDLIQFGCETIV